MTTTDRSEHPPPNSIPGVDKNALYHRVLVRLADAREREIVAYRAWNEAQSVVEALCELIGIEYDAAPDAGKTKGSKDSRWRLNMIVRVIREADRPCTLQEIHEALIKIRGPRAAGALTTLLNILRRHQSVFQRVGHGLYTLNPQSLYIPSWDPANPTGTGQPTNAKESVKHGFSIKASAPHSALGSDEQPTGVEEAPPGPPGCEPGRGGSRVQ